jgi:hypothetical protein
LLPAPTAGLITHSPSAGIDQVLPDSIQSVCTTGTPAAASSPRYRLSVFHATTSAGFARFGTVAAQALNRSRRDG